MQYALNLISIHIKFRSSGLSGPSFIPPIVKSIVILLHGYGSNGDDLFDLVDFFKPHMSHTAFYSPNAFDVCDANPFGGYQWFGLPNLEEITLKNGIQCANSKLTTYIEEKAKHHHLTSADVILIGFSQGSMMAIDQIFKIPLNCVIAFSGMFVPPMFPEIQNPDTPVMLVHGTHDTVVHYGLMAASKQALHLFHVDAATVTCPGLGHSIDIFGLKEALHFIRLRDGADKPTTL